MIHFSGQQQQCSPVRKTNLRSLGKGKCQPSENPRGANTARLRLLLSSERVKHHLVNRLIYYPELRNPGAGRSSSLAHSPHGLTHPVSPALSQWWWKPTLVPNVTAYLLNRHWFENETRYQNLNLKRRHWRCWSRKISNLKPDWVSRLCTWLIGTA